MLVELMEPDEAKIRRVRVHQLPNSLCTGRALAEHDEIGARQRNHLSQLPQRSTVQPVSMRIDITILHNPDAIEAPARVQCEVSPELRAFVRGSDDEDAAARFEYVAAISRLAAARTTPAARMRRLLDPTSILGNQKPRSASPVRPIPSEMAETVPTPCTSAEMRVPQ